MKNLFNLLCLTVLIGASSCKKEIPDLVIPTEYTSPDFNTHAAIEIQLAKQLVSMTNEAKKGRVLNATVSEDSLQYWYNFGNPNLRTINTQYFRDKLDGTNGFISELTKASGSAYLPSSTISGNGGSYGGYLFDENGLEIEQLIEKGQFGSVLYHHALNILNSTLTHESVDRVIAIFGAHPSFPNTPTASKTANPDKYMANYAARRDKNDGNGMYTQLKNAFILLKAAVEAGEDYNADKNEAIKIIKNTWEKVNAATVINYCHSTIKSLSTTNPTDAVKASALHAYGEGVGFIHGWRTLPSNDKIITDAQSDAILELMNAPYNGTPSSYKFVTDPVNELPKLTQVINSLKSIYGFTDQDIEDFKNNWVSIQGR